MAIAISDSVTVSIGDDTNGAWMVIFFVNGEDKSYNQKHIFSKIALLIFY